MRKILVIISIVGMVFSLAEEAFARHNRTREKRANNTPSYMGAKGKVIENKWESTDAHCNGVADCRKSRKDLSSIVEFNSNQYSSSQYPASGYVLNPETGEYVFKPSANRR